MKNSLTIERESGDTNPYAFDRLRKEGIEISQALSGNGWTDYNYHDPGVTILEQVCFALTDLIYRSTFDVTDYLCNEAGEINLKRLGLHAPQDVFFSRPCTSLDLQKSLVDLTEGAALISVMNSSAVQSGYGLHKITVRTSDPNISDSGSADLLKAQVVENYHCVRGLCEDLEDEVQIATEIDCVLQADISIMPDYRAASVLAELFFEAASVLAQPLVYKSYSEGLRQGHSLEEDFVGPFTKNGLISKESLKHAEELANLSLLESTILACSRHIPGIEYISSLRLRPLKGIGSTEGLTLDTRFRLKRPVTEADLKPMRASSAGQEAFFSIDEFLAQLDTISFARGNSEYSIEENIDLAKPPTGTYRNLSNYQSLQNQFPDNYGINQFGVPESFSPQRKAQALQLKSYLLLFEQIMSNYLANLDAIGQIFSIDGHEKSSYHSGVLSKKEISSLQRIYPENAEEILDEILSRIDNFVDRKSRVLDYLLALYGEEFRQDQLRGLNYYYSDAELERHIILNKIRLLNRIKFASGDRGGAYNFSHNGTLKHNPPMSPTRNEDYLQAASGLQYRSSILLGFKHFSVRSLTVPVLRLGMNLSKDFENNFSGNLAPNLLCDPSTASEIESDQIPKIKAKLQRFGNLQDGVRWLKIFRSGTKKGNYRYRKNHDELVLHLDEEATSEEKKPESLSLITGLGKSIAQREASMLQKILVDLSLESEGMHVVEHILLRPVDFNAMSHEFKLKFADRISVLFPRWTARSQDPRFRSLAEQTVRNNCPAHIAIEFYWLDFEDMCEFEYHYEQWLSLKQGEIREPSMLDIASAELIKFLSLRSLRACALDSANSGHAQLRGRIKEDIDQLVSKLLVRYEQLKSSPRREDDDELRYLQNLPLLQSGLKNFDFHIIQLMDLVDTNDFAKKWEFYTGKISVILPKLSVLRLRIGQVDHFYGIKDLVERAILEHNSTPATVSFYWLAPAEFNKFTRAYEAWKQNKQPNSPAIIKYLMAIEDARNKSLESHSWNKAVGDI